MPPLPRLWRGAGGGAGKPPLPLRRARRACLRPLVPRVPQVLVRRPTYAQIPSPGPDAPLRRRGARRRAPRCAPDEGDREPPSSVRAACPTRLARGSSSGHGSPDRQGSGRDDRSGGQPIGQVGITGHRFDAGRITRSRRAGHRSPAWPTPRTGHERPSTTGVADHPSPLADLGVAEGAPPPTGPDQAGEGPPPDEGRGARADLRTARVAVLERLGYELQLTLLRSPFFSSDASVKVDEVYERGFSVAFKQKFYQTDKAFGMMYLGHEVRFTDIDYKVNTFNKQNSTLNDLLTIKEGGQKYEYSVILGNRITRDAGDQGFSLDIFIGLGVGYRHLEGGGYDGQSYWMKEKFSKVDKSKLTIPVRAGLSIGYIF